MLVEKARSDRPVYRCQWCFDVESNLEIFKNLLFVRRQDHTSFFSILYFTALRCLAMSELGKSSQKYPKSKSSQVNFDLAWLTCTKFSTIVTWRDWLEKIFSTVLTWLDRLEKFFFSSPDLTWLTWKNSGNSQLNLKDGFFSFFSFWVRIHYINGTVHSLKYWYQQIT